MIYRATYIQTLKNFIDKPLIKVITGIRRSGKSTVLKLLREVLLQRGVNENQIIAVNLESFTYSELTDERKFYNFIKEKIKSKERYYLLLDEIQEVHAWEK